MIVIKENIVRNIKKNIILLEKEDLQDLKNFEFTTINKDTIKLSYNFRERIRIQCSDDLSIIYYEHNTKINHDYYIYFSKYIMTKLYDQILLNIFFVLDFPNLKYVKLYLMVLHQNENYLNFVCQLNYNYSNEYVFDFLFEEDVQKFKVKIKNNDIYRKTINLTKFSLNHDMLNDCNDYKCFSPMKDCIDIDATKFIKQIKYSFGPLFTKISNTFCDIDFINI